MTQQGSSRTVRTIGDFDPISVSKDSASAFTGLPRQTIEDLCTDGTLETRRAGRSGSPGWIARAGYAAPE